MKQVYLRHLYAQDYRNFPELSLDFAGNINVIIGANGSGKTNILESISLLSLGKGLKSAHFDDICRLSSASWKTTFALQSKLGIAEIESSFSIADKSRKLNYNGSKLSSTELANLLNIIWLTPQMEGLFLGAASLRRKFLDRIVYNFDPKHAKALAGYEHFMRERNKVLSSRDYLSEGEWLSVLEEKMAVEAKSIEYARRKAIIYMQTAINSLESQFPKARLAISSLYTEQVKDEDFIGNYMSILANNRQKDSYSGRANFGVHKTDFLVFHELHQRAARLCSTGEQKALLISVILASVESVLKNTQTTPIILLDELFVHLDDFRKKYLVDYITASKLQTFITTTDMMGIEDLAANAHIIEL